MAATANAFKAGQVGSYKLSGSGYTSFPVASHTDFFNGQLVGMSAGAVVPADTDTPLAGVVAELFTTMINGVSTPMVKVATGGADVLLNFTGASAGNVIGARVFISDDNTVNATVSASTLAGRITSRVSGVLCRVKLCAFGAV